MDEELLQQEIRKFLRTLGVKANQELAESLRRAADAGELDTSRPVPVRARITFEGIDREIEVEGTLELG